MNRTYNKKIVNGKKFNDFFDFYQICAFPDPCAYPLWKHQVRVLKISLNNDILSKKHLTISNKAYNMVLKSATREISLPSYKIYPTYTTNNIPYESSIP